MNCLGYKKSDKVIKPQYALERLRHFTKIKDFYVTTEVGQHQMWAAQFMKFDKPNRWMTSAGWHHDGLRPACRDWRQDGQSGRTGRRYRWRSIDPYEYPQEMSTAVQYRLPVKIFILNNQWMGMVRQWQEPCTASAIPQATLESLPDFVKLAEAYGGIGLRAETPDQLTGLSRRC